LSQLPEYELFAIKYATREGKREEHFIGGDPHDAPMAMDYFIWIAKSPERTIVIDTGFKADVAKKRKREFLRCPIEALKLIGVDGATVTDVVLSHLHYDHVGNFDKFPVAEFHLQETELFYAVGRHMRYHRLARSFEVEDVIGVVRLNYGRRVKFYQKEAELAPGITLHPTGGHTPGMQFVRVHTRRGWVVVASDAAHYYENMDDERPHTSAFNLGEMLEAYDALRAAAPSRDHIVPGHDPLVMTLYPAPSSELKGVVIRLDVAPNATA